MNRKQRDMLVAEIATLESFLRELPASRLIERKGFEKRLAAARARLSAIPERLAKPLIITFNGQPVEGMRSIAADFAGKALVAFTDATKFVATSLKAPLEGTGRLPGSPERSLRIVDKVVGSFGFELELPALDETIQQGTLFPDGEDSLELAVRSTLGVLREGSRADDAALSELVADMQPRAAKKIRDFAEVLVRASAGFAAEFEGNTVRLSSSDDARRVVDALRDDDLSEEETQLIGTITGILPAARRFEALLESGGIINGKLDRSLLDVESFKRTWVDKKGRLALRETRVRQSRRFVMLGASPIPFGPAE